MGHSILKSAHIVWEKCPNELDIGTKYMGYALHSQSQLNSAKFISILHSLVNRFCYIPLVSVIDIIYFLVLKNM